MRTPLYLSWFIAILMLVVISIYYKPSDESFLGYVETFEVPTASEFGGQVTKIYVKEGEKVKTGQILLELSDINLDIAISKIQHEKKRVLLEKRLSNNLARFPNQKKETSPLDLELAELQDSLSFLHLKRASLTIRATYDGVVGKIHVFSGQNVAAYQALLSVYHAKPNTVLGFLLEESPTHIQVGSVVKISSFTDPSKIQKGYVSSIGQRFIDLPLRLKTTNTASSIAWGREIQIVLPSEHTFLPSEKVKISTGSGLIFDYYQKFITLKNRLKNKS